MPSSVQRDDHSLVPSSVQSYIPFLATSDTPNAATSDEISSSTQESEASSNPVPTSTPRHGRSIAPSVVRGRVSSPTLSDAPSSDPNPTTSASYSPSLTSFSMLSDSPSSKPLSAPLDASSLVPSSSPTASELGTPLEIDKISDGESNRGAPTGDRDMSSSNMWKTVGASAAGGSLLAILFVVLVVRRMRRSGTTRTSDLPTVIPCLRDSLDPYDGFLSGFSRVRPDSTTSFAQSSTINNLNSAMLQNQLGIPIEVIDSMFDDVASEMSTLSPAADPLGQKEGFRSIPDESPCYCGDLAASSEDAYVDALEDPSFGATNRALLDLMASEKGGSYESLSQNSSLKGLAFVVSANSKEVPKVPEQNSMEVTEPGVLNYFRGMVGFPKTKSRANEKVLPLQDRGHYFYQNTHCKTVETNRDFNQELGAVNQMADVELATTSNMMTPKRSNRSNTSANASPRRFFRHSSSKMFEDKVLQE